MTPSEVRALCAELRAAYEKSTPGEWYWRPTQETEFNEPYVSNYRLGVYGGGGRVLCADRMNREDADSIALTHNALPRLLDAVEELVRMVEMEAI